MKTFVALAFALLTTPVQAQSLQFTVELRDKDGEPVALLSQDDDGFRITEFDADFMEVKTDGWSMRWAGRFENEASPSNLAMVRNNTFLIFEHPSLGEISCKPSERDAPNSWTRSINREALKAGFLNFAIVDCADALGRPLEVPGLPFALSATYALEN